MSHRYALIREHTRAIQRSAAQYARENHCPCGNWLHFTTRYNEVRYCGPCQIRRAA